MEPDTKRHGGQHYLSSVGATSRIVTVAVMCPQRIPIDKSTCIMKCTSWAMNIHNLIIVSIIRYHAKKNCNNSYKRPLSVFVKNIIICAQYTRSSRQRFNKMAGLVDFISFLLRFFGAITVWACSFNLFDTKEEKLDIFNYFNFLLVYILYICFNVAGHPINRHL